MLSRAPHAPHPCLGGPLHQLLHVVVGDLRGFLQVVDDGSVATDHRIADAVDVTLTKCGCQTQMMNKWNRNGH